MMNPELVTLAGLLAHHDWQYQYTDDHTVWRRGQTEFDAICAEQHRLIHQAGVPQDQITALMSQYRDPT